MCVCIVVLWYGGYMGDWFKNALGILKSMGTQFLYINELVHLPSISAGFMGVSFTLSLLVIEKINMENIWLPLL